MLCLVVVSGAAAAGLAVVSPRPTTVSAAVIAAAKRAERFFRPSFKIGRSPLCVYAYQVS
jgi:hypothetical protein